MDIILFQVNGPSGNNSFLQKKVCTLQHQKYVNCLKKRCLMYTAWYCQDLSFPFSWLTWYSFAISKCRNFWLICLSVSMIQNSKMSRSSEPHNYLSPVQIKTLLFKWINSLHRHTIPEISQRVIFYIRKSTAASRFMVTHKHYITCCPLHKFYTLKVMGEW